MTLLSATFLLLSSNIVSAALRGAGLETEHEKQESIGERIDRKLHRNNNDNEGQGRTLSNLFGWRKDADPNTALGRRQQFDKSDFVFDLLGSVPGAMTSAGTIQTLDVGNLPSLAGQGLSYALINIEPCGINLPHVHPRATELLYVISGKDLRVAFVEENGGRVIVNDIGMGEATFFPEGLIHYQQNLSCETATYIAALNSEDPGVITVTTQFFRLPNEAIQGSLGQDEDKVQQLIDGLPAGPADGRRVCMEKCGLDITPVW